MKLSRRLDAIYHLVDKGSIVADIGCDHAQLCCALCSNGICEKTYACDVNEMPLKQALNTISKTNNEQHVIPLLSNGLDQLCDDVDTIVIAGMGWETIKMILEAHPDKLKHRTFIVQSNTDVEGLRRWISDHRFNIIKECVVREDHYYQIIMFNTDQADALSEKEILFGKQMRKDFDFYSLWKYRLYKLEQILNNLEKTHPKANEIMTQMRMIFEELGAE